MTDTAENTGEHTAEDILNQIPPNDPHIIDRLKSLFTNYKDCNFRDMQESVIKFLLESTARIRVIQASTGFGKSLVGMVSGAGYGQFTYLVSSKQLQDQIEKDFPEVVVMKGRNNYRCKRFPRLSAAECLHSQDDPCRHKKTKCLYETQKNKALTAKYRVLNYHYFLTEVNYVGKFSENTLLICDEADLLEFLLTDFIALKISGKVMKKFNIPLPKYKTTISDKSIENWIDWAVNDVKPVISRQYNSVDDTIQARTAPPDKVKDLVRERNGLSNILSKIDIFTDNVSSDWIMESDSRDNGKYKTVTFKPQYLTEKLSHLFFFSHTKYINMMSATFPPVVVMSKLFGCKNKDFEIFDIPSTYAKKNRPVILSPTANLSYKTFDKEVPKAVKKIKEILEKHPGEKGVIHTVSYKLNKIIMDKVDSPRLITHDGRNRAEQIDYFKRTDKPAVIVSPSITRGVDFPGDQCTFIIIAKAPFKSLADKLTNSRVYGSKIGQLWYRSITAQETVQACGRGVRSKTDQCTTYIIDTQLVNLILDNRDLFPRYFLDALDI